MHDDHRTPESMMSIVLWKEAGAFVKTNGSRFKRKFPAWQVKAYLVLASSVILICQTPNERQTR
jgi:hypothetical protein